MITIPSESGKEAHSLVHFGDMPGSADLVLPEAGLRAANASMIACAAEVTSRCLIVATLAYHVLL